MVGVIFEQPIESLMERPGQDKVPDFIKQTLGHLNSQRMQWCIIFMRRVDLLIEGDGYSCVRGVV